MNGDGAADLVGFGVAGTWVALNDGGGRFAAPVLAAATFGTSLGAGGWTSGDRYPRLLADVNGDGRADIVGFGEAGVDVAAAAGFAPVASDAGRTPAGTVRTEAEATQPWLAEYARWSGDTYATVGETDESATVARLRGFETWSDDLSILHFAPGGLIDVGRMDVWQMDTAADAAFTSIGAESFRERAGEMRAFWAEGDFYAHGSTDFSVQVTMFAEGSLLADTFLL